MSDAGDREPAVFTIPPHRAFSDALVAGLMALHGGDPLGLAGGIVLLPNSRAVRAVTDAFVRRADSALLLPRLVPIGDTDLDDRMGSGLDVEAIDDPLPPAVDPMRRRLVLARLISEMHADLDAAAAIRLAGELARTLDQLTIERIPPAALAGAVADELSGHWQVSLDQFRVLLDRWPAALAGMGCIDLADRRNRILDRLAASWTTHPPPGFVIAAGIDTTAPAVAGLLRTVSRMPNGTVVLAGLDQRMNPAIWNTLGPHELDPVTGHRRRAIETHPQFQTKLLLDRMGVARGEVRRWRWGGGRDAPAVRSRAIGNAMLPAQATQGWYDLPVSERRISGVRALDCATPAIEAQSIALAIRAALEVPERTVALVTPDRALANRVVAHLRRWDIAADDSAGRPLSATPAGVMLLALAAAAAERFAPVALLSALKHPLVAQGEGRVAWLEQARVFDRLLRGPRPSAGLDGVTGLVEGSKDGRPRATTALRDWWASVHEQLSPLEQTFAAIGTLGGLIEVLRAAAEALCGPALWAGQAGRAAAELFADLLAVAGEGPRAIDPAQLPALLRTLMDEIAVRPAFGRHPRVFIWGLIEARLQHADLMILGGLNEGVWPAAPAPDPWLAPGLRSALGLPGLERRIGIAAQDFALALGAPQVLLTRARRDASAPTIASRFWLRLDAMTGGVLREVDLRRWADALDLPSEPTVPAARPAPIPPAAARPKRISVTAVDRLKADPFAFYARSILRLPSVEAVDADPGPAWRGTIVHKVLEDWLREDDGDPALLRGRTERMLAGGDAHPVMRALWQPRLLEAVDWIAARMVEAAGEGRMPVAAEIKGSVEVSGVRLEGTADRLDRLADGTLAIVDYKTGTPPSTTQVAAGYAMQLGLLGLIAEAGGFGEIAGTPSAFEYWSLARDPKGGFGMIRSPTDPRARGGIHPADFPRRAEGVLIEAIETWLTGIAPFTAKLHPEFAPYGEYDQLMRLEEWYGREA